MCIIAIKPQGKKMFNDSVIKTMFIANPDGAGFMYYDPNPALKNHVIIKKGYHTVKALLKALHSLDLKNTTAVLHFRIGTSGLNDSLNCHPYPLYKANNVDCSAKLAVAHNGVLHAYNPPKGSKINDTQMFINEVLNKLSPDFIDDDDKLMLIHKIIGTSKLAFLDNTGKFTTIGNFISDNGYLFSNGSYLEQNLYPRVKYYTPKTKASSLPKAKAVPVKTDVSKPAERYVSDTFWNDEPSDFWDDWDIRHPSTRH
ncbi:MAG: class II glutamine amidotransferase [Exiguobacterium sp.]|nr:class II glutamine amidotransferase [Exiguobacterium sp.]